MGTITGYKKKAGHAGFANKLQGMEAELICSVVDRIPDIPCFTTYDGIAVPWKHRERVEAIFRDETQKQLGFELKTKVKIDPFTPLS